MNHYAENPVLLHCPACDTPVEVDAADCIEGQVCFCNFCGAEPRFARERTAGGHHLCWSLVLTDVEYTDDE